jgi:hypothetical protein
MLWIIIINYYIFLMRFLMLMSYLVAFVKSLAFKLAVLRSTFLCLSIEFSLATVILYAKNCTIQYTYIALCFKAIGEQCSMRYSYYLIHQCKWMKVITKRFKYSIHFYSNLQQSYIIPILIIGLCSIWTWFMIGMLILQSIISTVLSIIDHRYGWWKLTTIIF